MASPRKTTKTSKNMDIAETTLKEITPQTKNQAIAFTAFRENNKNIVMNGAAGTGKSYVSLYLALSLMQENSTMERIVLIRSARPSVDMGFLPGTMAEKLTLFEAPYVDIVENLLGESGAYKKLCDKSTISFMSTSYMRGLSFSNAIVIVDEAQNCSIAELHTVATRIGNNCRLIVIGDDAQQDYMRHESSGYKRFVDILSRLPSVETITFGPQDVVRSGFAREYLLELAKDS